MSAFVQQPTIVSSSSASLSEDYDADFSMTKFLYDPCDEELGDNVEIDLFEEWMNV